MNGFLSSPSPACSVCPVLNLARSTVPFAGALALGPTFALAIHIPVPTGVALPFPLSSNCSTIPPSWAPVAWTWDCLSRIGLAFRSPTASNSVPLPLGARGRCGHKRHGHPGSGSGGREAHGARMQVRVCDALRVRHDVVRGVEGAEADRAAGRARAHAHAQVGKRGVDALELADELGVVVVEAQREGVVTEVGSMLRVCLSCACLPHRCVETLLPPKPNESLVGVGRWMVGVMRVKMVALVPREPSSTSSAA